MYRGKGNWAVNQDIGSQYIFNTKQIGLKQKSLERAYSQAAKNFKSDIELYDSIKWIGIFFKVGDYAVVSMNGLEKSVVRINRILRIVNPRFGETLPPGFIEIEMVLRKKDLPSKILEQYGDIVSEGEVFPTGIYQFIFTECMKGKATLLQIGEYGQLAQTNDEILFTRTGFDIDAQRFTIPPNKWKSDICGTCRKPYNPDQFYTECDRCQKWFHNKCGVFLGAEKREFICRGCDQEEDIENMSDE